MSAADRSEKTADRGRQTGLGTHVRSTQHPTLACPAKRGGAGRPGPAPGGKSAAADGPPRMPCARGSSRSTHTAPRGCGPRPPSGRSPPPGGHGSRRQPAGSPFGTGQEQLPGSGRGRSHPMTRPGQRPGWPKGGRRRAPSRRGPAAEPPMRGTRRPCANRALCAPNPARRPASCRQRAAGVTRVASRPGRELASGRCFRSQGARHALAAQWRSLGSAGRSSSLAG